MSPFEEERHALHTRSAGRMLFVFFLCLYILTLKGISTGDEMLHYDLVQRIVKTGQADLPTGKYDPETTPGMTWFVSRGTDGRVYLGLPHGLALASLPLGAAGALADRLSSGNPEVDPLAATAGEDMRNAFAAFRRRPSVLLTTAINPLASAMTVAFFFVFAARLARSLQDGLEAALMLGLATIVWPYSTNYWTQPLVGFLLLASLYTCWKAGPALVWSQALFAGTLAGAAFLCRFDTLLVSAWLLVFCVSCAPSWGRRWNAGVCFSLGLLSAIALQAAWNIYRFGSWMNTGTALQSWRFFRSDAIHVLPLLVASPYRGLLVYSPPLLLGLGGLVLFYRRDRGLAATVAALSVTMLVFFSVFGFWRNDITWGPRFLVPLTPFLLLPAALTVRRWRLAFWMLFFVGFAVQLPAVLGVHDPALLLEFHTPVHRNPWEHFWQWDAIAMWTSVLRGRIEFWWLTSPVRAAIGFAIAGVGCVAVIRALRACRSMTNEDLRSAV